MRRLSDYLEALRAEGRSLPAWGGRPNLRVIAEACGFDRGVFYSNQAAKVLLDEAQGRLGLDDGAPAPATAFEGARLRAEAKGRGEARMSSLEDEVIRLRAENARLGRENAQLRAVRDLMAETGRVP